MNVQLADVALGAVINSTNGNAARPPSPWTPGWEGWEMVAALGGIAAAAGTLFALYFLGRSSQDAATAAKAAQDSARSAAEEAAGAWRPVLVVGASPAATIYQHPNPNPNGVPVTLPADLPDEHLRSRLSMSFKNIGRGPALDVRVRLTDQTDAPIPNSSADFLIREGLVPENDGQEYQLADYAHPGPPSSWYHLTIDYTDLGGRPYRTRSKLTAPSASGQVGVREPNVQLEVADIALTTGDTPM